MKTKTSPLASPPSSGASATVRGREPAPGEAKRFFGELMALMTPADRRTALVLLGFMIFAAVLEVVSVGAVPAFVSTIVTPQRFLQGPQFAGMRDLLDISGTNGLILWSAAALIAVFGLKNGALIFNYKRQTRFITRQRQSLSARLIRAYADAPYAFHLSRNTAELIRNVDGEVSIICYQVMAAFGEICTRTLILIAVLVFLFVAEPAITLGWFVVFGTLAALGMRTLTRHLRKNGRQEQHQRGMVVKNLNEGLGSIKEARVLGREHFFADRVADSVSQMAEFVNFKNFAGKVMPPVVEFVAITGLLGIAGVLVLLDRPSDSILVTLSLFIVGLVRLRETVSAVMQNFTNFRYNLVSIEPVYNDLTMLEAARERRDRQDGDGPAEPLRSVALSHVSYCYDGTTEPALQAVNLTIEAGSAVAFVGSTGAGKSTVVDILLGLLAPTEGQVLVNGRDIAESGTTAWQARVGYIPQSIFLLDDTIRSNVALGLGSDEVDEERVARAVWLAQLDGFVNRQPHGLDTVVGERGARISGGERQRIGIARALYRDPDVLVMDEATSALDNATERAIIAAVEALKGQRTIIMIAHRLSTVRNCDRLFFLKQGRVEASGSYADLADSHEGFRSMAAA